jgi:arylsulfatase A-like enzyme
MPSEKRPNILVIWGDDIGIANLSCFSRGLTGYQTPNIDRIAKEGLMFTDSYGEQSSTAGRSSFITGQSCYRTGLSKVGIPAAPQGMRAADPTIAPHMNSWPDAGMTPFRNEKNSNWEGTYRVPLIVRWPGKVKAGVILVPFLESFKEFPPRQKHRTRKPVPPRTRLPSFLRKTLEDVQHGQRGAMQCRRPTSRTS